MFSALRIHMSENAYDEIKAFPEFDTVPRGEIFVKVVIQPSPKLIESNAAIRPYTVCLFVCSFVSPSVRLSVSFSDSVPFDRWRYARVSASKAFDKGQHGRLWQASKCYQLGKYTVPYIVLARLFLVYWEIRIAVIIVKAF